MSLNNLKKFLDKYKHKSLKINHFFDGLCLSTNHKNVLESFKCNDKDQIFGAPLILKYLEQYSAF